jgi:tetratricopeptide (TPR) repeat protein
MFRIKTKHQQLLSAMDKLLDVDPNNILTLRLFAEAMLGRSFWETAIFFIECIPEDERNGDDWLLIGESFLGLEKFQLAIDIASKILINFPNNMRARDLLWQSSVKHSMNGEYFGVK